MAETTRPSVARRMGRGLYTVLKMTVISLLIIVVIAAAGWAILRGYEEVNNSFDSVNTRVDANNQRVEVVKDDLTAVKTRIDSQDSQLADLVQENADLVAQIGTLEADLAALETEMADDLATAVATSDTALTNTSDLADVLTALQSDLNDSNNRIDALGGEVDGIRIDTDQVRDEVTTLAPLSDSVANAEMTVQEMEQTLALFHIWGLVSRARTRLQEGNIGLAQQDVDLALRGVEAITADETEPNEQLLQVQTRLGLALIALPDDPTTAVLDLDNTWNVLNELLVAQVLPTVIIEEAPVAETAVDETVATPAEETTGEETPPPAEDTETNN